MNKERAEKKWQEALRFIELCVELGAPIMQMPCQYRKDTSGDDDVIVRDLQRLADYAKQYDITIAWEVRGASLRTKYSTDDCPSDDSMGSSYRYLATHVEADSAG